MMTDEELDRLSEDLTDADDALRAIDKLSAEVRRLNAAVKEKDVALNRMADHLLVVYRRLKELEDQIEDHNLEMREYR